MDVDLVVGNVVTDDVVGPLELTCVVDGYGPVGGTVVGVPVSTVVVDFGVGCVKNVVVACHEDGTGGNVNVVSAVVAVVDDGG